MPEPATTAAGNGRRARGGTGGETGDERVEPPVDQAGRAGAGQARDKLAIKMLNDRVMVRVDAGEGERTSSGGIVIPATAQLSRRLAWAEVVAIGPNVRAMQVGDHVLFNPEDRYEVEVRGDDYIILRERDVHAVAASRLGEASTGLYL